MQHDVSLEISDAEYDDMITSFQKTDEKKWILADLTIDGTFVNDVSVRLKGNSTLMGVRGDDAVPGGSGFQPPEGLEPPEGSELPEDFVPGHRGGMMSSASEDDPTSLPLLISFDENSSGRAYQGMTELSVRPGTPVLNEAMALSLTAETGQPTQRYAYTVYSINGSATTTRLLLEHPDDATPIRCSTVTAICTRQMRVRVSSTSTTTSRPMPISSSRSTPSGPGICNRS